VSRLLGAESGARSSRLHLHEHQGSPVERDDVELAGGEAHVAPDDPPAGPLEAAGDELFRAAT